MMTIISSFRILFFLLNSEKSFSVVLQTQNHPNIISLTFYNSWTILVYIVRNMPYIKGLEESLTNTISSWTRLMHGSRWVKLISFECIRLYTQVGMQASVFYMHVYKGKR